MAPAQVTLKGTHLSYIPHNYAIIMIINDLSIIIFSCVRPFKPLSLVQSPCNDVYESANGLADPTCLAHGNIISA